MVVDILSMVMLSLVFYQPSMKSIVVLAILVFTLILVKKIVVPIFERYKGNRSEFELKFLLLVLLAFGFLSQAAGVHEAVISFILGIILSEIDSEHEIIIDKLNAIVFSFLAPVFFFSAGAMIQFHKINFYVIGLFIVFLTVSMAGKFAGTYFPLRYFSCEISKYAGVLFNYRLSFGLVTAIYGYQKKMITSEFFNIILLCVLFSSLIATYYEKKMGSSSQF